MRNLPVPFVFTRTTRAKMNPGGDIPIDVPTNENIGGDTSPASPAGSTPMIG